MSENGKGVFYPGLLKEYRDLLESDKAFGRFPDSGKLSRTHLISMLDILGNDQNQSDTKKHRWLGFIQHAIIIAGLTTVDEQRDNTRNLFNGD